MRTLLLSSAALVAASGRRFYAAAGAAPAQHWSAAPDAVPAWQPERYDDMYVYAASSPAYEPELPAYAPAIFVADPQETEALHLSEYGGRSALPLEDAAGSSSATEELLAYFAAGTAMGYSAFSMLSVSGKRTEREIATGAAGVGAFLGVWLFHSVSSAAVIAFICAYGSTRDDGLRKAGIAAAAACDKAAEIDEQFLLSGKVKSATDRAITATQNLNKNYGWTATIDEKLQLTERSSAVTAKVQKVKDAANDVKMKAKYPPSAFLKAAEEP